MALVEVTYVYNRGAHLWRESNVNAPRLPSGFSDFTTYLLSRDFDNSRDPVTGLRPISPTGNADVVRFDLSQTSSKSPWRVTVSGSSSLDSTINQRQMNERAAGGSRHAASIPSLPGVRAG